MVNVYLKYKVINKVNSKGWASASAPYLIFKHVEKYLVKTEEEADIIIYNNMLSREEIEKIDYHKSKKNIVIYINDDTKPIVVPNNVLLYRVS